MAFASGQSDATGADGLISRLVAQVRRIVRWQVLGLAVICGAIWWFLPTAWSALRLPIAIVFIAFVASYPLRTLTAVLQGMQELSFLSKAQLAGWAISTAATVGLVVAGAGLYALVIGWVLSTSVPAIASWWKVRREWPAVLRQRGPQPVQQYFGRSLWVSVSQIAQVLLNGSDVLILGRMLGPLAVVPYACTGKLVTVFANHPQLLMHAAQPALSELRASESKERLANVATALTHAMLMMSGALIVVILPVNHFFVNWWVGPNQYGGWWLSFAFAAMMLLRHWNVATIYTLFCFGYERQISLTSLADGIVTFVGAALMIWKWGPIGAPIASILGVVLVSLPMNVRSVAHEMNLSTGAFMARIAPLAIRVVVIAAAGAIGSTWTSGHSLAGVLAVLVPTVLAYAVAITPLAWNGPVGPYLRMAVPLLNRLSAKPLIDQQAPA